MATYYDNAFHEVEELEIPFRSKFSDHVFHQYTLKIKNNLRDDIIKYLAENNIPAMIYYPVPLYKQEAFSKYVKKNFSLKNVEKLCNCVFSLPIHTEIKNSKQDFIIETILNYFKK